MAEVLDDELAR